MALQDIIKAIIEQANATIEAERSQHNTELKKLEQDYETEKAAKDAEATLKREERSEQLCNKAKAMANAQKQHAILEKKQQLLDQVYNEVVAKLSALPDSDIEPLLRACLESITDKGSIAPSKKHAAILKRIAPSERFTLESPIDCAGGFRFSSEKSETDCTIEHLVSHVLRPATEVKTAASLFAA